MTTVAWEKVQLARAVKAAKARAGTGWSLLGADLKQALVRGEVLAILAAAASVVDTPQGRLADLGVRWADS